MADFKAQRLHCEMKCSSKTIFILRCRVREFNLYENAQRQVWGAFLLLSILQLWNAVFSSTYISSLKTHKVHAYYCTTWQYMKMPLQAGVQFHKAWGDSDVMWWWRASEISRTTCQDSFLFAFNSVSPNSWLVLLYCDWLLAEETQPLHWQHIRPSATFCWPTSLSV